MKLNKHYWNRYVAFITERIDRPKPDDSYVEKHHIWPRCLGGKSSQCVYLTAREHYIAHLILSRCFEDKYESNKMLRAFGAMSRGYGNRALSSRQFELARKANIEANTGENHYLWGKHMPESVKRKVSASMKGEKNHFYGKKHTDETRAKMSEKLKGKTILGLENNCL